MKFIKFKIKIHSTNRILCLLKTQGIELTKIVLLFVEQFLFYYGSIMKEDLDSFISEEVSQLKSSKIQPNENAIYNFISEARNNCYQ